MHTPRVTMAMATAPAVPPGCGGGRGTSSPLEISAQTLEHARSEGWDPDTPRGLWRAVQIESLAAVRERLEESFVPGAPWNVLALSGGGQWGAFGAGFLKGWTERTAEPKRPDFRVVTGTSTGSLIASFAFLGPAYDDTARDAHLGIRGDQDVFEDRWLIGLLFGDALASTRPLRRRPEQFTTPALLEGVAREGRKGRTLIVGAVDLDHGIFKPFDLTQIAARGGEEARQQYIDALMASTAISVAFPPVVIDGVTYVDGGVRRNIFLEFLAEEAQRHTKEDSAPSEATVYCLVNGTLGVGTRCIPRTVLAVAERTVDILLDESTDGNLLRIYLEANRAGLGFRMARIPPDACSAVGSEENRFDPVLMKCLYEKGRAYAREESQAWLLEPPLGPLLP